MLWLILNTTVKSTQRNSLTKINVLHYAFPTTFVIILGGIVTSSIAQQICNPAKSRKIVSERIGNGHIPVSIGHQSRAARETQSRPHKLAHKQQFRMVHNSAGKFVSGRQQHRSGRISHSKRCECTHAEALQQHVRSPFQTDLFMANNLMHMSDELFASSDQFVPERWLCDAAPNSGAANPFVFL